MRPLAILIVSGAIALSTGGAQSTDAHQVRWEAGPALLFGGPGVLGGGSVSLLLLQSAPFSLSAEVSGFTAVFDPPAWACVNGGGCRNGDPPSEARALAALGLRTTVPLPRRWYVVADAEVVQGRWRYPVAGTHRAFGGGVGLGRQSGTGRRSLELQWQRIGTGGAPVSTARVGWRHRW